MIYHSCLAAAVDSLGGVIDGHVVPTWGVEYGWHGRATYMCPGLYKECFPKIYVLKIFLTKKIFKNSKVQILVFKSFFFTKP